MKEVAQRYQDNLDRIKLSVKKTHDAFRPNYDRFNEFRQFVFESSLREEEITLLMTLSRPQLEFNVLEAYISRLLGEFSKQEPSICVSSDNEDQPDPRIVDYVDKHIRHILCDSENHHTKYEVYKDLLSGGFSVFKITTEYANPMSFDQVIKFNRAFDPTLCGFDVMARDSHKGDGKFCFELFPMEKEQFKEEYPDINIDQVNFRRDFAGFNWSYMNDNREILIVCDYYEKKPKNVKIVKLSDGSTVTEQEYKEKLATWDSFLAPPVIVGKPRMTQIDRIVRYRLIENKVLEYEDTDYSYFPLVFVDGNSLHIRAHKTGSNRQVTRPYVYHAKGAQRLKNYAGIALANEIENIVQHKFIIKKEALPKEEEWLQAIKDIQKPSNIVVNAFMEEDPSVPIPDPIREIMKIPAPPEVLQAFASTDSMVQNILGSYDASLGINDNQLSGTAVVEAATQSNAAAMPYIVGFMQGIQRVGQIIVDLIPKYYTSPRTIPIRDKEGRSTFVKVNGEEGPSMDYNENVFNVKIEAGASFAVQKSKALNQIIMMTQSSPIFGEFINTVGLPILLDNFEIRGIEQLKEKSQEWMQQVEQQKQMQMQAQQQEMQNNPLVQRNQIEMAKMQQQAQKAEAETALDVEKLKVEKDKQALAERLGKLNYMAKMEEVKARREQHHIDSALKKHDMGHGHFIDLATLKHEMNNPPEKKTKK